MYLINNFTKLVLTKKKKNISTQIYSWQILLQGIISNYIIFLLCPMICDKNIATSVTKSKLAMTLLLLKLCKVPSFFLLKFFLHFLNSYYCFMWVFFFWKKIVFSIVGEFHVTLKKLFLLTLIISILKWSQWFMPCPPTNQWRALGPSGLVLNQHPTTIRTTTKVAHIKTCTQMI
jgi:hypothetical protein